MFRKKMYRKKVYGKDRSVISSINKSATLFKCLKPPSFPNKSAKMFPSRSAKLNMDRSAQTRYEQQCKCNAKDEKEV